MTTDRLREGVRAGAFLIEEQGSISRDAGRVAVMGGFLPAGQLLARDDDDLLIAWPTDDERDCVGILLERADARTEITQATYVSRLARVRLSDLTAEGAETADIVEALEALKIKVSPASLLTDGEEGGGGWLLLGGIWNDAGVWDDGSVWEDAA